MRVGEGNWMKEIKKIEDFLSLEEKRGFFGGGEWMRRKNW